MLEPGESFEYTSGVPLPTPSGIHDRDLRHGDARRASRSTSRSRPSRSTAPRPSARSTEDAARPRSRHGLTPPPRPRPARTHSVVLQNSQVTVITPFSTMWSRSSCEKLLSMLVTLVARAGALAATSACCEDPHAALVEQPVEQPLARDRGIDQLDVLDGRDQRAALRPRRRPRRRRGARCRPGASPGSRSGRASARAPWAGTAAGCRRRASGGGRRRGRRGAPRRPRGGPGSGSARSAGNIRAPRLRGLPPSSATRPW